MCYHITVINSNPPPYMYLKQCVIIRSVNQKNILGVWLHFIINLQPLITDEGNVLCPIGGVENTIFDRVPWGRWWGGRIMYLWWRRGKIFVKEAFRWSLLLEDCKPIVTIEVIHGNVRGIEENDFV